MQGQVAIVTGAASGIGRDFAERLRRERPEMRLVLADRDEQALAAAFAAEDVVRERLDIRSVEAWSGLIARTVERFGAIDYLFNIAGVDRIAMFLDQPLENIDELIDTNLKGSLYGMRLAAERMAARGSGHIVNVASLAGIAPTPGTTLYSASKFGLRGVSLGAAIELRRHGVYVTVVCPDLVDTALYEQHIVNPDPEAVALVFSGPRTLRAEEVSEAIFRAMRERPLEIDLPLARGLLAKLGGAAPSLLLLIYEPLKLLGLRRLRRVRRERGLG